jgi:hypothetical protein
MRLAPQKYVKRTFSNRRKLNRLRILAALLPEIKRNAASLKSRTASVENLHFIARLHHYGDLGAGKPNFLGCEAVALLTAASPS